MITEIPVGMSECPRCGTPTKFMAADHLDRCGAGERWLAREYIGRSTEDQNRMRAAEIHDVTEAEKRAVR